VLHCIRAHWVLVIADAPGACTTEKSLLSAKEKCSRNEDVESEDEDENEILESSGSDDSSIVDDDDDDDTNEVET
jgi:hypothetical protein